MFNDLRSRIEQKLESATLERSPFPHLIIEDFFPADVYAQILEYNPFKKNRGKEWLAKAHSAEVKAKTPYYARKQINFHTNDEFEATPQEHAFWEELKSVFLEGRWFEHLVAKKYAEYFRIRFGDLMDEPDMFDLLRHELFLQRHEVGYNIGPHTDIPSRIFTCIFSFAEREGFEEFGTELLKHKDRLVRCTGRDHYFPDDFEVVKIAPYRPNNFLLFFKTPQSFHSVRAINNDVPAERYGMQFQCYEPKGGLFKDLSAPLAMKTETRSKDSRLDRLLSLVRG